MFRRVLPVAAIELTLSDPTGTIVLQLKLFKTEKAKVADKPLRREQTPTRLHRGQDTPRHLVGTYFSF
jgi:hypothetical protein